MGFKLPSSLGSKKAAALAPQPPKVVPKVAPKPMAAPNRPAPGKAPVPTTVMEGPKRAMLGRGSVRVGRRYTILGAIFAILFVVAAGILFIDHRAATYGTAYVSTSAQMRMLTQRIAKAAQTGLGAADEAGLRSLGDALREHAHLRGSGNVGSSIGGCAIVDEPDACGDDKENRKDRT